MIKLES